MDKYLARYLWGEVQQQTLAQGKAAAGRHCFWYLPFSLRLHLAVKGLHHVAGVSPSHAAIRTWLRSHPDVPGNTVGRYLGTGSDGLSFRPSTYRESLPVHPPPLLIAGHTISEISSGCHLHSETARPLQFCCCDGTTTHSSSSTGAPRQKSRPSLLDLSRSRAAIMTSAD